MIFFGLFLQIMSIIVFLKKFKLFDVSPVTFPAYQETDVGIRGLEEYQKYKNSKENKNQKQLERQKQSFLKAKFKNI